MKIKYIIKGIALFLFIIGTYSIITQIKGLASYGRFIFGFHEKNVLFWFFACSLIIPLFISVLSLFGSYLLFVMKNMGRILMNTGFLLFVLFYSAEFVLMKMINTTEIKTDGWFVFYHFSWNWEIIIWPTLYLSIVVFINLRVVRKDLNAE